MPTVPGSPSRARRHAGGAITTLFAALAVCLAAGAAQAQTWNEVGDAGALPATAQSTAGAGVLTKIQGSILSASDVDMYCVRITDRANWSACVQCAGNTDVNVWLFDALGQGVSAAQLCQGGCKLLTGALVPSAGYYYLAVSPFGLLPFSGANSMWTSAATLERAPDGPGAAGAITAWGGSGTMPSLSSYTINLFQGTTYCNAVTSAHQYSWGRVRGIYR